MLVKQPDRTYRLGDPLPAIPSPVASWPWPGSPTLTKWSVDMLKYPLGTLIYDVVDGHPVLAQIQTHSWYGAHPDWPATPHKGTSVFVPTTVNAAGKKVAVADPPDGWGEEPSVAVSGVGACAPGDPLCTDLPDESAPPPAKKSMYTDTVFLNGRPVAGVGECAPGDPLCTDLPDESAPPPVKKRPSVFLNGRLVSGFGIGENFCPTLPYNCPPRPWGPDEGPDVSIADRLGTGEVGTGLACRPREWKPVGVDGFNVGNFFKGVAKDTVKVAPVSLTVEAVKNPKKLIHDVGHVAGVVIKIDKFVLEQAQGIISLIPGIGTGISSAISAGLAILDGGGPIVIAIKTAYGAIPIPIGIRTFTDMVLNAALDLLKHGTNLKDDIVRAARDAVGSQLPAGVPRDVGYRVYDTLAHLILGKLRGKPTQAKVAAPPPPAQLASIQRAAASGQPLPATVTPLPPTVATFKPLAQAEQAQSTQITVTVPAGGAAYGPYPQASASIPTAGVGALDRGGHGGGGGHGRGGWHGGYHPAFRGRGRGWGGRGGYGWGGPWWPYVVVGDASCASWGAPIELPADLLPAVRTTVIHAGGDPVAVRGADGGLYLLTLVGGPQLVTVRPCIAQAGLGDTNDDILRMMALDLLASLRRTGAPQYATRSVKNFARAWNAASADTQIDTSGKYTQETAAALQAALGALAPGSGAVPAAVL